MLELARRTNSIRKGLLMQSTVYLNCQARYDTGRTTRFVTLLFFCHTFLGRQLKSNFRYSLLETMRSTYHASLAVADLCDLLAQYLTNLVLSYSG